MTKENFEKIFEGKTLAIDDLTPDEKKALTARMQSLGMSPSTTYLRFFRKGFDKWEIQGVTSCKDEFLTTATPQDPSVADSTGNRGYGYVLSLSKKDSFYKICKKQVLCAKLHEFMYQRGMSRCTALKRFKREDWKPWELIGIKAVIEDFLS